MSPVASAARQVAAARARTPATPWQWRDRVGELHRPATMATTHVFHSVRAIWNSVMPADARIPGCRVYAFDGLNYPSTYLLEAVRELIAELGRRDLAALDATQRSQLHLMIGWLSRNQVEHAGARALTATNVVRGAA